MEKKTWFTIVLIASIILPLFGLGFPLIFGKPLFTFINALSLLGICWGLNIGVLAFLLSQENKNIVNIMLTIFLIIFLTALFTLEVIRTLLEVDCVAFSGMKTGTFVIAFLVLIVSYVNSFFNLTKKSK